MIIFKALGSYSENIICDNSNKIFLDKIHPEEKAPTGANKLLRNKGLIFCQVSLYNAE